MGKLKKLVATACFITMTIGAVAPAEAALKEKDIVWIGSRVYNAGNSFKASEIDMEGIYWETVIYSSRDNSRMQLYFCKNGKRTGFVFEEVVPLAEGKFFFVSENMNTYEGYILDDEGNKVCTNLKDVADHIGIDSKGYHISNSGVERDRFICGETKDGLVILDTKNNCKVLKTHKGYVLGTNDEIYKKKVNNTRYILITNKKKTKRGFMSLSQKSGVSIIIANNLKLEADLLINNEGEYRIAVPQRYDSELNLYNTKGRLIWSGKNKTVKGVGGNILDTPGDSFAGILDPPKGVNKRYKENKIIFLVQSRNDKYGLVRDDGKQLLSYKYNEIREAYKDKAIVLDKKYLFYMVNYKGGKAASKKYNKIYGFYGGMSKVDNDDKYGVISETGRELIKPEYDEILRLKSDEMILKKGLDYIYRYKNGKDKVFAKQYENIEKLPNTQYQGRSLFLVTNNGKFGIMSAGGKELHKTKYDYFRVLDKQNGVFSLICRKNGKTGGYLSEIIVDKEGKKNFEINNTKSIERLASGEYMVMKGKSDHKDSGIDEVIIYSADWKKKLSIKNRWESILDYDDGLFIVRSKDDNYGVVDSTGKMVLPNKYSWVEFNLNLITVKQKYDGIEEIGFLVR